MTGQREHEVEADILRALTARDYAMSRKTLMLGYVDDRFTPEEIERALRRLLRRGALVQGERRGTVRVPGARP